MNKLEDVWLSNIEIKNQEKFELIEKFGNTYNLYKSSLDDLVYFGVRDNIIDKILDRKIKTKALYDYEYIMKNNINIISYEDKEYPENFRVIKDKPVSIYVRGNVEILNNKGIAIIGSRMALNESLEISRLTANAFSMKGYNVISGLAKGIDKYAHLGSLDSNGSGKTIGILACGVDRESFYPYENLKVYDRIINEGGAILSEYPISEKPKPYYFPFRNRLISGISEIVFVVQASTLKSGSIITVDYGLEQGKDIYVYKSKNIENPYFAGNRLLIEEGAKILKI